jgi:hypothetical protein
MEKEFIPYEIALKLKELGFDEPCLARYLIVTFWERVTGEIKLQMTDCAINEKYLIKAPLYQQAFRWFREKHNLHCNIDPWGYCIFDFDHTEKTGFETYEEAELECLKKLIKIIK